MARAARLVDEFDLEPLRGRVLLIKACCCSDPDQGEAWARQALQLTVGAGDRDLELWALSEIGAALIAKGTVDEGMPLVDEALAGALAGEGQLDTVIVTACRMMQSCDRCADFQRAVQWVRAMDPFIERYGRPVPQRYLPRPLRKRPVSHRRLAERREGVAGGGREAVGRRDARPPRRGSGGAG